MKNKLTILLLAQLSMFASSGAALAQSQPDPMAGINSLPSPSAVANEPTLLDGPSQPAPLTGETVPPPGPPPQGEAAQINLPDCVPGKCGTPQIMAP